MPGPDASCDPTPSDPCLLSLSCDTTMHCSCRRRRRATTFAGERPVQRSTMPSVSAGRRDGVAADPVRRGARAARSDFGLDGTRFGATSVWKVCTAVGRVVAPGRTSSAAGFKTAVSARTAGVPSEATVRRTTQAAPSIMRTPANVKASSARRAESQPDHGRDSVAAPVARWPRRSSPCACSSIIARAGTAAGTRGPRDLFSRSSSKTACMEGGR